MVQRKCSQAGFSLVEMLVAVFILAIGLLGLAELQITAMKTNTKSEGILASTALAQRIIEDVTSRAAADPLFNAAVNNAVWPGSPFAVEGGGSYNVSYDVQTNYGGVANLCLVRVRVIHATSSQLNLFGVRPVVMTTLKRST